MSVQKYKITNTKASKPKHKKLVIICLVVIILIIVGIFFVYKKQSTNKDKDTAQITSAKTNVMDQDNDTQVDQPSSSEAKTNNSVSTNTSDQIPTTTTSSIKIVSVNQSGGQITVDAETSGDSGGKCVFSFTTPDDKPVVKEVVVSGNKCNTSIPEVEFTKLGTWNLTATYYVNDKKVEVSQNVTIN